VDKHKLYIGLADAFGEMKTREAIPFLIKNISLQRWLDPLFEPPFEARIGQC
jgi:hypothetical protein